MKLSRLAWMGVAAVVVTGCSSVEKERASGGFEYVNIQPTASLNIQVVWRSRKKELSIKFRIRT